MDGREFRNALGSFVTGVTVITTQDMSGTDYGVTANSFNSVSLDPPLVLWSLARTSTSLPAFEGAKRFAIHILASDQVDLSARFAQRGTDKFVGLDLVRGEHGTPLFSGCSARFICRPAYTYEGGDHVIFVGEVLEFEHREAPPLAFHGGNYALTARHGPPPGGGPGSITHLIQSCYFHLLTPVREERERLGVTLSQHYFLNALFSQSDLSIAEVNEIVGYTGVRIEPADAAALVARGLINVLGAAGANQYQLTALGREATIGLIGASVVKEENLAMSIGASEMHLLTGLLDRALQAVARDSPAPVHRHMELLQRIHMQAR